MFEVLMYLFEAVNYSDNELMVDRDDLTAELSDAGFRNTEILKALDWLDNLATLQNTEFPTLSSPNSFRIYSKDEADWINAKCRGHILFLEQIKILDSQTRELVIDCLMKIDQPELEIEDLQWVILMVLYNLPEAKESYQQMEVLMYDTPNGYML